jgi:hypothetical protein
LKASFSHILGVLISIGVGCFFLISTWYAYLDYAHMQNYSGQAIGQVINKHFQIAADGGGNYYLDYSFVPASGSKIDTTGSISKQQWDALQVDDKLAIRYDPANPKRNIPLYGGSPSLVFAFFMLVLGAVFILFGVSRFLTGFKKQKSRT